MARVFLIAFIMTICFSSFSIYAESFYMAPNGNDGYAGTSPDQPWATLQHARTSGLGAGDTLFIMGGTYTNAQYFLDQVGAINGSEGSPLVFKAYGDAVAVFTSTGPHESGFYARSYFLFYSYGNDHIVIDGYSYLDSEQSLYLKFEGHENSHALIKFFGGSSNYCENIVVKGVEIDGGHTSGFSGGSDDVTIGIALQYCRRSKFEDNYIHHIHHPTGDIFPGDNSDRIQSSGHGIYLFSCELLTVYSNRIERCNHGAIEMELMRPDGHPSRYCKIINNIIDQHYGGGIYLVPNPHHNLIEGNLITHCGESTTFSKPGIQLSGSNNTLRKNVLYNPNNQSIRLEAQTVIGYHFIADDNLIYNNTVFTSPYGIYFLVKNGGSPDCSTENNTIANNIFYLGTGVIADGKQPEMAFWLYDANDNHNWCDPNESGCLPHGSNWGGNTFHNNCIRRNSLGPNYNQLVIWARDQDYGGGWTDWTLGALEDSNPVAWANNHGSDPLLHSESPDTYGLTNGWWHVAEASPCIDGGIPVYDEIGAYVESLYPGYGWGNLTDVGLAPDIGAFEFDGENPAPLSGPFIRISPTNR